MTYKQIEASREARLWIRQVIVPAVVGAGAATVLTLHPELKDKAKKKISSIKSKFKK